ncbi:uncharacterized protein LOC131168484 [Malania oleifera]|uniref:uncharacterized protein LOC131168484 n=1 Tax=Malania oleifera TaxID=397392 RepID=UPI0025AE3719|nr:uncharacterized protein LOC131168484 [Malania oleifera]
MGKILAPISRKKGIREVSSDESRRKSRHAAEDGGELFKCSGRHCRSCAGGVVADCVAVCCCPCAVLNLLALALIKVPWTVGRRCLGLGKSGSRKLETRGKCRKSECDCVIERDRKSRRAKVAELEPEISSGFIQVDDEHGGSFARLEAEKVWSELYEDGHLGFGRVSFRENQSQSPPSRGN